MPDYNTYDYTPNNNLPYPNNSSENVDLIENLTKLADAAEAALDERVQSSNISTSITSSSTNAQVAGAKAVYDYVGDVVGDINSLLDQMNREVV